MPGATPPTILSHKPQPEVQEGPVYAESLMTPQHTRVLKHRHTLASAPPRDSKERKHMC